MNNEKNFFLNICLKTMSQNSKKKKQRKKIS